MEKLYVIIRNDLPPGAQAAQACHGLRAFVDQHADLEQRWFRESNNLVLLQVPSEQDLEHLIAKARDADVPYACFLEPDFSGAITSVVLGPQASRMVANLPLALRTTPAPS